MATAGRFDYAWRNLVGSSVEAVLVDGRVVSGIFTGLRIGEGGVGGLSLQSVTQLQVRRRSLARTARGRSAAPARLCRAYTLAGRAAGATGVCRAARFPRLPLAHRRLALAPRPQPASDGAKPEATLLVAFADLRCLTARDVADAVAHAPGAALMTDGDIAARSGSKGGRDLQKVDSTWLATPLPESTTSGLGASAAAPARA